MPAGRRGSTCPSISIVLPIDAASQNSRVTRRIC
jgi:hypothetical protein